MKNFNSMADDYNTSQSNLITSNDNSNGQQPQAQQQQHQMMAQANEQQQQQVAAQQRSGSTRHLVDEMSQDLNYLSREAPLDGGESTFGAATSYSQLAGSQRAGAGGDESVIHMGSDLQDYDDTGLYGNSNLGGRDLESPQQLVLINSRTAEQVEQLSPDNVDIQRQPLQQTGSISEQQHQHQQPEALLFQLKPFLVSFMVDARGGAMRGCRHSGVRVIIPPNSAQMPMRITCRYLRRERLVHPPPLMEGEACASKIMEVGPAGAKFLGPVLIEVPHFASLRGKEREIIILRSDTGEIWREHLVEADDQLIESIIQSAQLDNNSTEAGYLSDHQQQQENLNPVDAAADSSSSSESKRRLTRIVTNEFPQYFAIISRIRQEVHAVGPQGSTVNSQVVPRVQANFPQGALKKRIKIGLQGNKTQAQQSSLETDQLESISSQDQQQTSLQNEQQSANANNEPTSLQLRSISPDSGNAAQQQQDSSNRPGSSAAKRRSRFLACFGGNQGSIDLLDSATTDDSGGSAGGDSPRQACKEKPVERRHIIGDIEDSDGETRNNSPSPMVVRRKRQAPLELVPDDYYIEKEPLLILNVEPKTYGKRLASSSAQTENKVENPLSTLANKPKSGKRRGGGLLRGRRKHKTQLNILCDAPPATRPKSALGQTSDCVADSSLDTVVNGADSNDEANIISQQQQQQQQDADDLSIIQDVITSDDQKWRTCTIQTDSDSVTVNYVTISDQTHASATQTTGIQDDGYVSGSGDINRQSSLGKKGLFGLTSLKGTSGGGTEDSIDEQQQSTGGVEADSGKRSKKQAKKSKKAAAKLEKSVPTAAQKVDINDQQVEEDVKLERPISPESLIDQTTHTDDQTTATLDGTRSVSPSSKELKMKLKLERQEKLRREKDERKQIKELEEAANKAEKVAAKAEKEAAKKEKLAIKLEKEAKKAEKLAAKKEKSSSSKKSTSSPVSSLPQTPQPPESLDSSINQPHQKTTSVKFASALVETNLPEHQQQQQQQQLDSIQQVIETTANDYENQKKRLSQEDGHDMVNMSIGAVDSGAEASLSGADNSILSTFTTTDKSLSTSGLPLRQPEVETGGELDHAKLISFSDSEEPSRSLEVDSSTATDGFTTTTTNQSQSLLSKVEESISSSDPTTTSTTTTTTNLKPILKQQSTISSQGTGQEDEAEIVISEQRTSGLQVGEASGEDVKVADALKVGSSAATAEAVTEAITEAEADIKKDKKALAKLAKEQKAQLKRELKAQLEEEKRLVKEAKLAAKEAAKVKDAEEAESKRLAKEAKKKLKLELKLAKKSKSSKEDDETVTEPTVTITSDNETSESINIPSAPPATSQEQELAESKQALDLQEKEAKPEVEKEEADSVLADVSKQQTTTVSSSSTTQETSAEQEEQPEVGKKSKKQKKNKKKKTTTTDSKEPTTEPLTTEPVSSSSAASKSTSFLGRLFSKRSTSQSRDNKLPETDIATEQVNTESVSESLNNNKQPEILSEMYPSDPDDADGEMILEVNVPKSLIDHQQMALKEKNQQVSELGEISESVPEATTTIDESLNSSTLADKQQPIKQRESSISSADVGGRQQTVDDQEATLVNVSQMVTSEVEYNGDDDDDATENVVSQANDITNEMITETVTWEGEPTSSAARVEEVVNTYSSEPLKPVEESTVEIEPTVTISKEPVSVKTTKEVVDSLKGTELLSDEKKKEELEAKLDKEAKKRLKEEEKLKKKQAKEEELRVKLERKLAKEEEKKRAKEEKERLKREAKEAKKLAKKQKKEGKSVAGAGAGAPSVVISEDEIFKSQEATGSQPTAATEATSNEQSAEVGQEVVEGMEPVNTETEVQRIVEEVMGEDGVMTRTTKTIETKYVTMRHEEVKQSERRDMSAEEYAKEQQARATASGDVQVLESEQVVAASTSPLVLKVPAYEHAELEEIRSTPSYFSPDFNPSATTDDQKEEEELTPKKAMKRRIKLNQKLVQRALKLAKVESKKAKKSYKAAHAEIAVCDEAARQARKDLKRALKEAKRASKVAAKDHKKMDKIDKKLAKRQLKIEKRQRKLDKRAAKLAKKEAKKREKTLAKEAKALAKAHKSSSRSSTLQRAASAGSGGTGSRKSIRLEDIGEPVLKSSSRMSIGGNITTTDGAGMVIASSSSIVGGLANTVIERASPTSDDIQVEMSLEDGANLQQQQQHVDLAEKVVQLASNIANENVTITEGENDTVVLEQKQVVVSPEESSKLSQQEPSESDEEIDVVNDLPVIGESRKLAE